MLTDAPPRTSYLTGFRESDRITTLDLPEDARLSDIAKAIEWAMKSDQIRNLRRACAEFLKFASEFYHVPDCGVRVLAARPLRVREQWTTELFGDFDPEAMLIRVWMRTAARKDVTLLRHVPEHALSRILPSSRLQKVRIRGFVAHSRLLRENGSALPSCTRYATKALVLGTNIQRPLAHRLAEDESKYAMSDAAHRHLKPAVHFQLPHQALVKIRLNTEPKNHPSQPTNQRNEKQGDSQNSSVTFPGRFGHANLHIGK